MLILSITYVHAQTNVSGTISSSTQWTLAGSPYVLSGAVSLDGGAILTVDAGALIYMGSNSAFTVKAGKLLMQGTSVAPIQIASDQLRLGQTAAAGDWGQWTFSAGTQAGTELDHVTIQHGKGLVVNGSTPIFNYVDIRNQLGAAMTLDLLASPSGEGNSASSNQLNAISVPAGDITGAVRWSVKGIPYYVGSGILSVGQTPYVTSVSPSTIRQGETIDVTVSGSGLAGLIQAVFDNIGLQAQVVSSSASSAVVKVIAAANAAFGMTSLKMLVDAGEVMVLNALNVANGPAITSVTPTAIRQGQTATVNITGSNLEAVTVTPPGTGFTVSGVQSTSTTAQFNLVVASNAPQGVQGFIVSNSSGSATASITINPKLPTVTVSPVPLAIPPDNVARQFTVVLSNSDTVAHTINLSLASTGIASVSPASVTIAAGATSAHANITGLVLGNTTLKLDSTTLGNTTAPVYVTNEIAGLNTSYAPNLGVVLQAPAAPAAQQTIQLPVQGDVGVVVGGYLGSINPTAIPRGTVTSLTLYGKGLDQAQTISLLPADGVTLGVLSVAADGLTASVPVTVADTAAATLRQVIVKNAAGQAFPAASATADRLQIANAAPVVESLSPINGVVGNPIAVTLRGRNLQQGKLQIDPLLAMQIDSAPVINADGTAMTFNLIASTSTALGEHVITVTTPGGVSSNVKSSANTFTVVTSVTGTTPVYASLLGVVLQADAVPAAQPQAAYALPLGVSFGSVISGVSPKSGVVGQALSLALQGSELTGMTGLTLSPAAGVTVGAVSVAADGKSATVPLTIASDAATTVRTLIPVKGSTAITFANPTDSQFQVTLPLPQISSITPINVQQGSGPLGLTIRGVNFKSASQVSVVPATGISVSQPPVVNADYTQIDVNVTIAADAPTGQRAIVVTTPAGVTSSVATTENTLSIGATLSSATPVVSALLGVELQSAAPPPVTSTGTVTAALLGVNLQAVAAPAPTTTTDVNANAIGVVVGAYAKQMQTSAMYPGVSGTLTVTGSGLSAVTSAALLSASDVTLGTPVIAADGLSMTLPVTIAASAQSGTRQLVLNAGSATVPFTQPDADRFVIAKGVPTMTYITPILAKQGDLITMTVHGTNLSYASAVTASPGNGIKVGTIGSISADGTQLTVSMDISASAALGASVIQVTTPGGITAGVANETNTFTVYAP
jgi:hypothetical protein